MSDFRRRLMMVKQKKEYIELDYLIMGSNQYINTEYIRNQNTNKFEIKWDNSGVAQRRDIFGDENERISRCFIRDDGTKLIYARKPEGSIELIPYIKGINELTLEVNSEETEITYNNNIITDEKSYWSLYGDYPVYLGGLNYKGKIASNGVSGTIIKIYYFKIYENNALVRDMIPVIDNNGIVCMYDKITNKFYYNQGNGEFSKPKEYIKDGLQLWLDGIDNTRNGHTTNNLYNWEDLSGNAYDFDLYSGVALTPEEKCMHFNGDAVYSCTNTELQELMIDLKERTIEIVCSISDINSDAKTIFLGGKSGALNSGVGMWYSVTRGGMAVSGNSNCFRTSDVTNPHTYSAVYNTISINSTNFYQDNVLCTRITGGTMASSYVMIGGRNYNGTSAYRFYGKIYCIRVYDRQLTQEEREHNRLIDRERFGI